MHEFSNTCLIGFTYLMCCRCGDNHWTGRQWSNFLGSVGLHSGWYLFTWVSLIFCILTGATSVWSLPRCEHQVPG